MNFSESISDRAKKTGSLVCLGLDPMLDLIPEKKASIRETLEHFFVSILSEAESNDCLPNAVKPNYAFFAQHGFEGLFALQSVISFGHELKLPVILDAKRGDIGKTSAAYAAEAFDFWNADAVTVAPYMGSDSVSPFVEYSEKKGKGVFVLVRTSNKGAGDFQNLRLVDQSFLFEEVAKQLVNWGKNANGNLGAVVGATSLSELELICGFFAKQSVGVPLLIPGVGSQGGSASETLGILRKQNFPLETVLINSSSGILFAHQTHRGVSFEKAAVIELQKLQAETRTRVD